MVLTATELEGCSPAADWSRWIAAGRAPDSGRGTAAVPFARSWAEDLEQLAALGADAVVLTLEWAELEPRPGVHSPEAVEFRRDVLRGATAAGMRVWGCLVDRTLPGWFAEDEGGFEDDRGRGLLWPRHVDWIGETFGDLVDGWIPQREPLLQALRRFWLGTAPPGRHDATRAAKAVRDAVLVDGEAWRLLRGTAPVATHQTACLVQADGDDPLTRPQAAAIERLLRHSWIGALTEGRLQAGDLPEREVDHLRDAFDRVVVQVRPPIGVDGRRKRTRRRGAPPPGSTGRVASPEALAEALHRVTDELEGREIVAAADLADVADDGRPGAPSTARSDHEQFLLALVDDQDLAGFWQSSPIDGYHFEHGFALHPGLLTADRSETAAAAKFQEVAGASSRPSGHDPAPDEHRPGAAGPTRRPGFPPPATTSPILDPVLHNRSPREPT